MICVVSLKRSTRKQVLSSWNFEYTEIDILCNSAHILEWHSQILTSVWYRTNVMEHAITWKEASFAPAALKGHCLIVWKCNALPANIVALLVCI